MDQTRPLIAVLDDEPKFCKALARLLQSHGFSVVTFTSGKVFLDTCATRPPDCVVLDLHMPDMNGFEVQERIARLDSPMPVIIMTGHDTEETRSRAMAGKPMAYLRKPINEETLLDAIELAIRSNPKPMTYGK
jgi:FixJ family two-component response regulator